jgi:hypothetical protein
MQRMRLHSSVTKTFTKTDKNLLKSFGSTSYLTAHNDLLTFMFSMDCKELDTHLCIVLSHGNGLPPPQTPVFSVYLLNCWHCSRSLYTWSVVISPPLPPPTPPSFLYFLYCFLFLFNLNFYCIFVLYYVVVWLQPRWKKRGEGGKLCINNKVKINKKLRIGVYHCLLINHGEWITCTVENTDKRTNGRVRPRWEVKNTWLNKIWISISLACNYFNEKHQFYGIRRKFNYMPDDRKGLFISLQLMHTNW